MIGEILDFTGKGYAIICAALTTFVALLFIYKGVTLTYKNEFEEGDTDLMQMKDKEWATPRRIGYSLIVLSVTSILLAWCWVYTTQNHLLTSKISGGLAGIGLAGSFL